MFQTRAGAHLLQGVAEGSDDSAQSRPRQLRMAPFASISTNLIRSLGQAGTNDTRREPATGIEHPYKFCFQHKCPQLAGIGVRAKKILGIKSINVYSLGVYVDGSAAKRVLGNKFKSQSSADLAKNQSLFDELIAADGIDKTLRLVISFGSLKRAQFLDALEERLAPPLKQARQTATLEQFKKQFDNVEFKKGMEITFAQHGHQLVTLVGGKEVGRLNNAAFNAALWGIYLGPDPVSPDTKSSLGSTLAAAIK